MKPPRYISGELFLRGPIQLSWLAAAGHLGGRALHVGVYLWHLAGLQDNLRVKLSTRKLQDMGVRNRQATYQALAALERHGLLLIERHPGRCPVVTLVLRNRVVSATSTAADLS